MLRSLKDDDFNEAFAALLDLANLRDKPFQLPEDTERVNRARDGIVRFMAVLDREPL